jgi:hypothetical protein
VFATSQSYQRGVVSIAFLYFQILMAYFLLLLLCVCAKVNHVYAATKDTHVLVKSVVVGNSVPIALGTLYDATSDQFVPVFSLWNQSTVQEMNSAPRSQIPFMSFTLHLDDTFEARMSALDLTANIRLSLLCGLIHVDWSSSFIKRSRSTYKSVSFSLIYNAIFEYAHLDMSHLMEIEFPEVIESVQATHVVVGIEYGASFMGMFSTVLQTNEVSEKVSGMLGNDLGALGGLTGGSGVASVHTPINNRQVYVECAGDLSIADSISCPDSLSQVSDFINSVLRCHDKKCGSVPKKVYLLPLSELANPAQQLALSLKQQLSDDIVLQSTRLFQKIADLISLADGLYYDNSVTSLFQSEDSDSAYSFKVQVYEVQKYLNSFKDSISTQISEKLIEYRKGSIQAEEIIAWIQSTNNFIENVGVTGWLENLAGIYEELGYSLSILEDAIGGTKTKLEMSTSSSSWLVLVIHVDDSFRESFGESIELFVTSGTTKPVEYWRWKDTWSSGDFLNHFQDLRIVNSNDVYFNILAEFEEKPVEFLTLQIFSEDEFITIQADPPVNVTLQPSGDQIEALWDVENNGKFYGFKVNVTDSYTNQEVITYETSITSLNFSLQSQGCFQCVITICTLFDSRICGEYSEPVSVPLSFLHGTTSAVLSGNNFTSLVSSAESRLQARYFLNLTGGKLVLTEQSANGNSYSRWTTNYASTDNGPYQAVLRTGGELQILSKDDIVVWSSGVSYGAYGQTKLVLNIDGSLTISDDSGLVLWNAPNTQELPNVLRVGEYLCPDRSLVNGQARALMQQDGNFVIYITQTWVESSIKKESSSPVWASQIVRGNGQFCVTLKSNCNLIYVENKNISVERRDVWESRTALDHDSADCTLTLGDDQNMKLFNGEGSKIWESGTAAKTNVLLSGGTLLSKGRALVNGQFKLAMDPSGNLVYYKSGVTLWSTQTFGNGYYAFLASKGNLQVLSTRDEVVWSLQQQNGCDPMSLVVQDRGNLEIQNCTSKTVKVIYRAQ